MLRLTPDQLTAALAGLSSAERLELLGLLEAREALEAEQPLDTRRSLEDFAAAALREAAQQSGDPDEFMRQHAAHDERREFHAAKLLRQRPAPEDGRGVLAWTACLFADATAAAIEDGFPAPGAAAAPASEPEEAAATPEAAPEPSRPPHMGGRRAGVGRPLPDETRDDVAVSRARDRATRPPAAADDLEVDRLAPFRGIGPIDYFSHHPDD